MLGDIYDRFGSVVASFNNAQRLLDMGELVGIFPEGIDGVSKGIWRRYRLQRFSTGFIRLSLLRRVPIIPVVVVGAEETYPVIGTWNSRPLKQLFNLPYVPVTPLFPLFGALGLIPLPTKWRIRFGAPIRPYEERRPRHASGSKTVRTLTEDVRRHMQSMLHTLLAERESIF
jgi:1-acyl-sn-glycerol-3-phosphate acyltransferase